jgi:signal transduction histidine kinase
MAKRKPTAKTVKRSKRPAPARPPQKTPLNDTEELAALCARQRLQLTRAGRSLHDQAGPLLSAAGIHLQLLKMDLPAVDTRIQEITKILEQALENVRAVSQELSTSPIYRGGLERALANLADETAETAPVDIVVDYEAKGPIAKETAVVLYDAIACAVRAAVRQGGASEIEVRVRDKPSITARITDNGRSSGRAQALSVPRMLAGHAGLKFDLTPGKSTIVSIRAYATRSPTGR